MTDGAATPAQMGAFLIALRVRGETVEEITGAVQMMRSRMHRVTVPEGAVDIVGTGGDGHGTYNISTCAALVAAGAGLKIAKHGNRRASSMSGASDVLAHLGVKLEVPFKTVTRCVEDAGFGFMWAPMHHPALKHWAPVRTGSASARSSTCWARSPTQPASSARWWACSPGIAEPIAHVLRNLGPDVWVVMGTTASMVHHHRRHRRGGGEGREVTVFEVTPADAA
jgi:anthranilate phosphoribosyltransferase